MHPDSHPTDHPLYLVLFGIALLVFAVISTCTGKTLTRGGSILYRAQKPKTFWWRVALLFLGGVFLFGLAYLS
jgi:RsiW-degrading membrane proteinase PrsW (M82 family)